MLGDYFVEDIVLVDRDGTQAPAGAAEVLAIGIDAQGVPRELTHQRSEARHEGSVNVVRQQNQIRSLLQYGPDLFDGLGREGHGKRVAWVDDEERLDLWIEKLLDLLVGVLEFLLLLRVYFDEVEVVVLEVRHLEVRGEDRHAERDRVAGVEDPVALQRLKGVAHGGGAAFDRVDLKRTLGSRISAHRPKQVFVNYLFVVDQHAVRDRVVIADDGIRQLVHELVGVEAELLHRPRDHFLQEGRSRHVVVLFQPVLKAASDALCLGHAAHARRQVEHPLTLSHRKLPEQEERVARRGRNPVRVAATGVQVGEGIFLRRLRSQLGDEILDLERAQFFVLLKIYVH